MVLISPRSGLPLSRNIAPLTLSCIFLRSLFSTCSSIVTEDVSEFPKLEFVDQPENSPRYCGRRDSEMEFVAVEATATSKSGTDKAVLGCVNVEVTWG